MNLKKAPNSTHKTKRIGRGQGSGMGKTATKGGKGQTARKGYNEKRGFEGGQQPLQRRLPKVGFSSKITKPYAINVEKIKGIKDLAEISFESLKDVHKFAKSVSKIKLIGKGAKELASKIKDERISTSGQEKNSISNKTTKAQKATKSAKAENSSPNSAKSAKNSANEKTASVKTEKTSEKPVNSASEKAENSAPKATSSKAENSTKAEKASSKTASKAENSAKNSATKTSEAKASKKATSSATKTKSTKKESEAK